MARKPKDVEHGKHSFQGLRYDRKGNPLYTSNTLSNDEAKEMGWKYSKKHGLYGQINDPTKFYESKKQVIRLTESDLHNIIKESVKKVLNESMNPDQFVIVSAWDNRYYKPYSNLIEYYADAMVSTKYDGNVFILPKNEVYSFLSDMSNIEIYKITDSIQTIDEIEECLLNGDISLEMLEEID